MLKRALAILQSSPSFTRFQTQLQTIAGLLAEKSTIPLIAAQLPLIQDLQTDDWWQDLTLAMLETTRLNLRGLVQLLPKQERKPIYTDFEDTIGVEMTLELPPFKLDGFEQFRLKARAFLKSQSDNLALLKLRTNKQLTPADLAELERILAASGVGAPEDLKRAKTEAQGLGLFVRSLVGLDREVAKQELAKFLDGKQFNAKPTIYYLYLVSSSKITGT